MGIGGEGRNIIWDWKKWFLNWPKLSSFWEIRRLWSWEWQLDWLDEESVWIEEGKILFRIGKSDSELAKIKLVLVNLLFMELNVTALMNCLLKWEIFHKCPNSRKRNYCRRHRNCRAGEQVKISLICAHLYFARCFFMKSELKLLSICLQSKYSIVLFSVKECKNLLTPSSLFLFLVTSQN